MNKETIFNSNINVPVLLIVFNRPDKTKLIFEEIKKAKPTRLYVASDGPRAGNKSDAELISQVRAIVENVDWNCDLYTLFRSANIGCQFGPRSGIDWFFSNEDFGIILEDDCLPSQSFFPFCSEMLEKYANDERIMSISGTNIARNIKLNDDYCFSNYALMWGWATWRRAWEKYDGKLLEWDSLKRVNWLSSLKIGGIPFVHTWTKTFDTTKDLGVDATWWDYQWIYSCWRNSGLTIIPSSNLVRNIGHSSDATHTFVEHPILSNLPLNDLSWPLRHPKNIAPNKFIDRFIGKHWFCESWLNYAKDKIKEIPYANRLYKIKQIFSR